ncbi:MAG: restriction endonuclease subunit S, partial [Saezia sp.]
GSKQPEVRFNGFSEDWEEKRIGSVLKIKSGLSQKSIEEKNGVYPILATGGEIGRTNTPLYSKESVLIGRKGTIDKPYYMNSPFWTVDTLFYSELFDEVDGFFVYTLFQKIDWRRHNTSTGVPSLTSSAIHDIHIQTAQEKEEQEKIGIYFKQLDQTIALQAEQLKKLKHIKKAYLAKMFV